MGRHWKLRVSGPGLTKRILTYKCHRPVSRWLKRLTGTFDPRWTKVKYVNRECRLFIGQVILTAEIVQSYFVQNCLATQFPLKRELNLFAHLQFSILEAGYQCIFNCRTWMLYWESWVRPKEVHVPFILLSILVQLNSGFSIKPTSPDAFEPVKQRRCAERTQLQLFVARKRVHSDRRIGRIRT